MSGKCWGVYGAATSVMEMVGICTRCTCTLHPTWAIMEITSRKRSRISITIENIEDGGARFRMGLAMILQFDYDKGCAHWGESSIQCKTTIPIPQYVMTLACIVCMVSADCSINFTIWCGGGTCFDFLTQQNTLFDKLESIWSVSSKPRFSGWPRSIENNFDQKLICFVL